MNSDTVPHLPHRRRLRATLNADRRLVEALPTPAAGPLAARLIAELAPLPDPMRSNREYARLSHHDLPARGDDALAQERRTLGLVLALSGARPHWWHVQRLARIDDELRARRQPGPTLPPARRMAAAPSTRRRPTVALRFEGGAS